MLPIEGLFCPCCTPTILHTIAQSGTPWLSRQHLVLGTGALIAVRHQALRLYFVVSRSTIVEYPGVVQ
jgi:hypothetical protein